MLPDIWPDIAIAVAAALVAIVGVVYDPKAPPPAAVSTLKRIFDRHDRSREILVPRALVILAIGICGFAIFKSVNDEFDKQFTTNALTETLTPTPELIGQVSTQMEEVAKARYKLKDYWTDSNGMVILLNPPGNPPGDDNIGLLRRTSYDNDELFKSKYIVLLSSSELAHIRAKIISNEDASALLHEYLDQNFEFRGYHEDLYARLCALFSVSARQVLLKEPVDCDHRDAGVTLTVNLNKEEKQIQVSVKEIERYAGADTEADAKANTKVDTKVALSEIGERMRAKIRAIAVQATK
jgi:hypothetical protein